MAPVLGLCALLAADAVLIGWAFRGTSSVDPAGAAGRTVMSSAPSVSPSAAGSSGAPSKGLTAAPLTRFVAPVGADIAWVVDTGTCDAPGTITVTVDGGDSWDREDLPGRAVRARPSGPESGFVTGGDDGCDLRLWSTGDAGAAWGDPASAADAWSRMPGDDRAVHLPNDEVDRPCGADKVLDLTVIDAQHAYVVCQDGAVRATTDGGAEWPERFTVTGALSLGMLEGGAGVVVRTDPTCPGGVRAVAVASERPTGRGRCVKATAAPGQVSVAGTEQAWWLVVGDAVFRSDSTTGPWTRVAEPLPTG